MLIVLTGVTIHMVQGTPSRVESLYNICLSQETYSSQRLKCKYGLHVLFSGSIL